MAGAMLTLTYYVPEKRMPHYNVMGRLLPWPEASVRYLAADLGTAKNGVAAISAGPDQDACCLRHRHFRYILELERAQLAAAPQRHGRRGRRYRCLSAVRSSRAVTGEIHHVDAGYHIVGMKHPDAPDIEVGRD